MEGNALSEAESGPRGRGGEGGGRRSRPWDTPPRRTLHGAAAGTPRGPGGDAGRGTRDAASSRARPPLEPRRTDPRTIPGNPAT